MLLRTLPRTGLVSTRARRHLLLGLAAGGCVLGFYLLLGFSPENWVDVAGRKADTLEWRISMALAYTALLFFMVTLTVGPMNALRNRPRPAHSMLRRDIAIWAGFLALAHLSFGIWIHTDGWQLWGLYFWRLPSEHHPFPLRKDWFGLANLVGTVQALIVVMLLGISNNASLRRLGTRTWKTLQRFSYLAFGLVIVHGVAYQIVEQRLLPMRIFFFAVVAIVLTLQLLGARAVIRRKRQPVGPRPVEMPGKPGGSSLMN